MTQPDTRPQFDLVCVARTDAPRINVGPGRYRRDFPCRKDVRVRIGQMDPGAQWSGGADHDSFGEDILRSQGEPIEDDQRYPAGLFLAFGADSSHRPRTEADIVLFGLTLLSEAAERPAVQTAVNADGRLHPSAA